MAITTKTDAKGIGSWQEVFDYQLSDRVKELRQRATEVPGVCLEHAMVEMEVRDEIEGKNIPRIIERAMIFKRYLEKRTIRIDAGELIVGNVCSKYRGSPYFGELYNVFAEEEIGHPELDPTVRQADKHQITEEERKTLRETIIPYFKGKTFEEYLYSKAEGEIAEKGFGFTASCSHIPNTADLLVRQDAGHMFCNYEKILRVGFKGILSELKLAEKECRDSYSSFNRQERLEWYEAAIMSVEAVIAHSKRFADYAVELADKEKDETRKKELLEIARVTAKVPENPAENWHEALQGFWFTHMATLCEQVNYGNSFGRFDQYMYPYFKKDVLEDKGISRDWALELLECLFVKTSSFTEMYDAHTAYFNMAFPLSQNMLIGGMLPDGTDGCNDLTMLVLEADEQVGMIQPELAMRIWEGTPDKYLRKACEVVRLGRGKPKFYGDRTAMAMMKKAYPLIEEKYLADYAVIGCVEIGLPFITQNNSFAGVQNYAKIVELTLNDGRCQVCGRQVGPMTGDPRTFESMEQFKTAFRTQVYYWQECMAKAMKLEMECQGERLQLPFSSCLIEGPIQKGVDMMQGGAWNTHYGIEMGGMANVADSFAVIDTLVFKDKKVTMDELVTACNANWEGYEELRQICINEVPHYGNDDDYADLWATYICDLWYDTIDHINRNKDLIPKYGGQYSGGTLIGNGAVGFGQNVHGLPDGHIGPNPLSDTWAPVQGHDSSGTAAVIKSITKLPAHRFELGTALNQRFTPEMLATDEDVSRFMDYLRTAEELGLFHVQFNVINSDALYKAMEAPDEYRDLLVRVASYVAYFVELSEDSQLDIINRTEQNYF